MVTEGGAPLDKARALAREALAAWRGSDPDQALEACDHALALLIPVGPSDALADVLRWKGSILRDRGNHTAASDLYAQSLAVADAIAYRVGRAHALNCMGTIAQFRGDLSAAERWYGEAARLAHRIGDRRLSAMVQQNLGIVAEVQQRTDEAVAHFRLALASFEQENDRGAMLLVLNNLGVLYTRENALPRAGEALERALEIARAVGDAASEAAVEENRAALFLALGNFDAADASAGRAYAIADQRKDNTRRAAAFRVMARVSRARGQAASQAVKLLERALSLCELGEDVQLRAEILSDLGDACHDAGETSRARECWRSALEIARIAGFTGMVGGLSAKIRPSAPRHSSPTEARS